MRKQSDGIRALDDDHVRETYGLWNANEVDNDRK